MSVTSFVHFDHTAFEALKGSKRCVAEVSEEGSIKRCGQRFKFGNLESFYERNQNTPRNELPLSEIAELCLCTRHHKRKPYISHAVEQWTREISGTSCPPSKNLQDADAPLTPQKRDDGRRLSTLSPDRFEVNNRHDSPKKIDKKILDILNMRKKINSETEFVYIFSAANIPNKFKIGYTTSKEGRFKQWSKCYPNLMREDEIACTDAEKVEKLVHAELDQNRQKHACEICKPTPVSHCEWFEKELDDILQIIKGWAAFVDNAYLENGEMMKPEYTSPFAGFSQDEGRWQSWIRAQLKRNQIILAATPELVEDLTDVGSSELLATPKTDFSGAYEAPPSPILLPIPGALPTVEEHVGSLPSARETAVTPKPLGGKAPKEEEERVTFFGLAKRIVSVVAGYSS
ncbi:T5orf172 domain-containing protein [Aspergillus pseudocaelatus]|uniref:T5orf172 domain-containing protein n=1 Tax=Aspergillus pseudocaelatus TaxID=1825620 RepID=A0ABQ6X133_9EURO|nr:T5orf172 domain-containing protein [Aspergillus pseudocaelatus]